MKVVIKTLTSSRYELEIDPKDTMLEIKRKIKEELFFGLMGSNKLIHRGKILKDDQTVESVGISPNDLLVAMVWKVQHHLRLEIDDKCHMKHHYTESEIENFQTFKDFKSDICTKLDDDIAEFIKYYDLFAQNKLLSVEDMDENFGINHEKWLPNKSMVLQIRTKDNKLWYRQHYEQRVYLLVIGYIRIHTKRLAILLPTPIKQLCNTYYCKTIDC